MVLTTPQSAVVDLTPCRTVFARLTGPDDARATLWVYRFEAVLEAYVTRNPRQHVLGGSNDRSALNR